MASSEASQANSEVVRSEPRMGKLAHEKGSGAPCLKCGPDGCPDGLDLHFWRKVCRNCSHKMEEHDVKVDDKVHGKIVSSLFPDTPKGQFVTLSRGMENLKMENASKSELDAAEKNFIQVPEGTSRNALKKYMDAIPKDKAAHASEDGEKYRQQQLQEQLPAHDFDESFCNDLTEDEKTELQDFNKQRNEEAFGQGAIKEKEEAPPATKWVCSHCDKHLLSGDVAIFAERAGDEKCWHPECFICHTCKEMLVDLLYFYKDGEIYCGRHYAELTKVRCNACDELIFCKEYTQAEDKSWHIKHFCCRQCDVELGGQKYVAKDNHPYCLNCYNEKFAKKCHGCGEGISLDDKRVNYKDYYWHSSDDCFCCAQCKKSLIEQQFLMKGEKSFCSVECAKK